MLQQEAHWQLQEYTTKLSEKKYLHYVQFVVRMHHRLCEREYLCEYVHKCEHIKACQIHRGAKFGKKHMAATGEQDTAIRKKYINCVQFFCENASPPLRK